LLQSESVLRMVCGVPYYTGMEARTLRTKRNVPIVGSKAEAVDHVLNNWVMTEHLEHGSKSNATLVADLVKAIRETEETRADPWRTPKTFLPLVGLVVAALINAGIMWAKVAALESKMSAVDSINVVASQVSNLQNQMASENRRLQDSQNRLEERIEKLIESQARVSRERAQ
jgi:hypothetical protein